MRGIKTDSCTENSMCFTARIIREDEIRELREETRNKAEQAITSAKLFPHSRSLRDNADYYSRIMMLLGDYEELIFMESED